jgi:hypothetical protein
MYTKESIRQAICALGGPKISDEILDKLTERAPTKDFYSIAGKNTRHLMLMVGMEIHLILTWTL